MSLDEAIKALREGRKVTGDDIFPAYLELRELDGHQRIVLLGPDGEARPADYLPIRMRDAGGFREA
jgi:hypothetical protein